MASISFASESLMDPRIQVKLDKYQKCGNIISQTSLLSSNAEILLYNFHCEHNLLNLKIKKLLRKIKSKNLSAGVVVF